MEQEQPISCLLVAMTYHFGSSPMCRLGLYYNGIIAQIDVCHKQCIGESTGNINVMMIWLLYSNFTSRSETVINHGRKRRRRRRRRDYYYGPARASPHQGCCLQCRLGQSTYSHLG